MCKAVEELVEKRAEKRAHELLFEEQKILAERLLANGKLSVEEVAECMQLPIDIVEELGKTK